MLYIFIKIVHLFCACVLIGYLVYDVFVFGAFRKGRSEGEFIALKREILAPSVVILGASFVLLLSSGAILGSFYMGGDLGFWQNATQRLLWLKIASVALLFIITPVSFYFRLVLKKPDPFRRFYHHIALILCLIAFFIANLLFAF